MIRKFTSIIKFLYNQCWRRVVLDVKIIASAASSTEFDASLDHLNSISIRTMQRKTSANSIHRDLNIALTFYVKFQIY